LLVLVFNKTSQNIKKTIIKAQITIVISSTELYGESIINKLDFKNLIIANDQLKKRLCI
jgi:hypothetical protein